MGIFTRKSAPRITREQVMNTRPVRNPSIEVTRDARDEVSLRLPRRRVWWINLLARLGGIPAYRLLTLDRVGSSVWELCDGEHTVKELIARLAEEHKLSRKEAELSMVTYLRQLAERGVIVLAVESKDSAHE